MPSHYLLFLGVVVAIVLLPGPDTAVVTKNALVHGRDAALGSAIGINVGLLVWTVATALGMAAILRSSAVVYDTLRLVGALYLIWMGARALWDSRRPNSQDAQAEVSRRVMGRSGGFRQGIISNLANPKVGIFFTSLLPQFVSPHGTALLQLLMLGSTFIVFNIAWLGGYAIAAVRLSDVLSRTKVKARIDRVTGVVLVGVGLRLAVEH